MKVISNGGKSMCLFCDKYKNKEEIIYENDLVFVVKDYYPVSKGHMLVITKRHILNYFDTTREERIAVDDAVVDLKKIIDHKFMPDGYNIGTNVGYAAGQSVLHFHVHVIPRYRGDVDNPRGGVRGVIPAKQNY